VGRPALRRLLEDDQVSSHPFVIGELACGHLKHRTEFLEHLTRLPSVAPANHAEAMHLLEARNLAGRGISWIDVHLLASAMISKVELWSLDQRLHRAARDLRVAADLR
jgi:predicted nucleic acid-binding protein